MSMTYPGSESVMEAKEVIEVRNTGRTRRDLTE